MKSEKEIKARIEEVYLEEVTRRVDQVGERLPHKCAHNYRHPLDARKVTEDGFNPLYNRVSSDKRLPVLQTVGLCLLGSDNPTEWGGTICDEPIDAKRCPLFTPGKTKEDILADVKEQIADEVWLKSNMPEVYALMWALGEISIPKLPWWTRLLIWLRSPLLEPQSAPPEKLLQSGE